MFLTLTTNAVTYPLTWTLTSYPNLDQTSCYDLYTEPNSIFCSGLLSKPLPIITPNYPPNLFSNSPFKIFSDYWSGFFSIFLSHSYLLYDSHPSSITLNTTHFPNLSVKYATNITLTSYMNLTLRSLQLSPQHII